MRLHAIALAAVAGLAGCAPGPINYSTWEQAEARLPPEEDTVRECMARRPTHRVAYVAAMLNDPSEMQRAWGRQDEERDRGACRGERSQMISRELDRLRAEDVRRSCSFPYHCAGSSLRHVVVVN